ncbi:hypothetical protein [Flaviflexus huanghaiensis]|uniref:hypothetical protein n=1 Tax=Flaviflexus huanghaiensis TaxID=1111473 RepID=UPI0015FA695D|nr:hypothetical protein [Flaviflexus huanghaiensis]
MEQFAKLARGSIAPDPDHPALGPLALADADGSLYIKTDDLLPGRCIDGRRPTTPYATISPCAPGASLSLLIGLAATRGITDPMWGAGELAARLTAAGLEPGIHTGPDDHSSGCGALDSASEIISLANETEPLVRECADALDMAVSTTFPLASLAGVPLDSAGIYRKFDEDPGSRVTPLRGVHSEIAIVVNHEKGTTIDQNTLDRLGEVDVFDVDVWSLEVAADWLAEEFGVDRDHALSAMNAFTIATLAFLAQPSMTVLHHT